MIDLQFCPRCDGQQFDRGSCSLCFNTGLLDQNTDPVLLPALSSARSDLLELQEASRDLVRVLQANGMGIGLLAFPEHATKFRQLTRLSGLA